MADVADNSYKVSDKLSISPLIEVLVTFPDGTLGAYRVCKCKADRVELVPNTAIVHVEAMPLVIKTTRKELFKAIEKGTDLKVSRAT